MEKHIHVHATLRRQAFACARRKKCQKFSLALYDRSGQFVGRGDGASFNKESHFHLVFIEHQ